MRKANLSFKIKMEHIEPIIWIAALILLWEFISRSGLVNAFFMPPPSEVFKVMFSFAPMGHHFFVTLQEVLIGFSSAIVVGIALAILIVHSRHLERGFFPIILFTQSIPKSALAPIFTIWFGFGMYPKIMIAFLITFFPVFVNSMRGFKIAESDLLDLAHSMRATTRQIFTKIRFPRALPYIFTGLRIAAPLAVLGAVVGEFIAGDAGLGFIIQLASYRIDMPLLFASLTLLAAMGIFLFGAVMLIEKLLLPWYNR